MAKVINIIGSGSNVGKTYIMEGLIKELKSRGLSIATIKHDVHGFDIDKEGKDTYKHRKAGSETVIISSKNRRYPQHFSLCRPPARQAPRRRFGYNPAQQSLHLSFCTIIAHSSRFAKEI